MSEEQFSPEGHRKFDAREMPSLLLEVDGILAAAGCTTIHLVTVGGASMLTRIVGRHTGDIDIISEGMSNDLRSAAEAVALRHNLDPNWINDAAKGFAVNVSL